MDYLKNKRPSVFHKAFETGHQAAQYVAPIHPKDANETERLLKLFTGSFLTKNLDHSQLRTLADAMFSRRFSAGENIIRFGDIGTEYFVLAKGSVRVTVYKPGTSPSDPQIHARVAFQKDLHANPDLDPAQGMIGFGEIALLYNDKRTASVTALTDCNSWVLTGECFKFIIAQNSIRRRNISLDFLNKVELFNELEQYEKIKLIDGLTSLTR
jgi:CRP-like cAMP-binding protein